MMCRDLFDRTTGRRSDLGFARYLPTCAQGLIDVIEAYAKTSYPGHRLGDLTGAVPRPINR